ncbi:MAG: glycosyltransferase family 2 protein [Gemmatimonadetes bacterium]|nr:glycosyltransferase family 2 protein [Gemmatimonadota bacterium]
MTELVLPLVEAFNLLVLVYFGLINTVYGAITVQAVRALGRYVPSLGTFSALEPTLIAAAPPITVFAPAYNEEATCVESVRSLLALDYPEHEILVVNDGSSDGTLARLKEAFDLVPGVRARTAQIPTARVRGLYSSRLHPNLWVLDKENGGKADALNAAVNHCVTPLFCAMDADSLLERDALMRIVRPFLEDATTVAAGGMIRVANSCRLKGGVITEVRLPKSRLARFQVLEYLRAFLVGRVGWTSANASLVISGAFGLFKRLTVVGAGGYASRFTLGETVGEDMELVVRLKRHCQESGTPCRIAFVPDAVAWTEVPEDLRTLGRQRDRWQRGLYESLVRHRQMLFNPRYGFTGMIAFPHFFFLEMVGPIIEVLGYGTFALSLVMGWAVSGYVIVFFLMAVVLGALTSLVAVALEEYAFHRYLRMRDVLSLFLLAVGENFGYRQLTVFWRFRGMWKLLRGQADWGRMQRKGFDAEPTARLPQKTQAPASPIEV